MPEKTIAGLAREARSAQRRQFEISLINVILMSTTNRVRIESFGVEDRRYRVTLEGTLRGPRSAGMPCCSDRSSGDVGGIVTPGNEDRIPRDRLGIPRRNVSDRTASRGQMTFREGGSVMVREGGPGSAIRMVVDREPHYRALYGERRLAELRNQESGKEEGNRWRDAIRRLIA